MGAYLVSWTLFMSSIFINSIKTHKLPLIKNTTYKYITRVNSDSIFWMKTKSRLLQATWNWNILEIIVSPPVFLYMQVLAYSFPQQWIDDIHPCRDILRQDIPLSDCRKYSCIFILQLYIYIIRLGSTLAVSSCIVGSHVSEL